MTKIRTTRHASRTSKAATIATLAGLTLTLAACGGSDDPSNGGPAAGGLSTAKAEPAAAAYEFENARVYDQGSYQSVDEDQIPDAFANSVTVRLSDELQATIPEGRALAVEKYDLSSEAISPGVCRVDIKVTFAKGGRDSLLDLPLDSVSSEDAEGEDFYSYQPSTDDPKTEALKTLLAGDIYTNPTIGKIPSNDDLVGTGIFATEGLDRIAVVSDCEEEVDLDYTQELAFPYLTDQIPTPVPGPNYDRGAVERPTFAVAEYIPFGVSGQLRVYGSAKADVSPAGKWVASEKAAEDLDGRWFTD